jgi:tRNA G37 N-methylase Trm5
MSSGERTETVETVHGTFVTWRGDLITEQLRRFSAHTRNELAMLRSFLRKGDRVIDIGAHIGTFAVPLARSVGAGGAVYCFEANADNYALLVRNAQANGVGRTIRPVLAVVWVRPCSHSG